MTEQEQIRLFADKLDELVDQYRSEFDLTYASIVGALAMKSHLLMNEAESESKNQ